MKRFVSFLLALVLIISLSPQLTLDAYAVSDSDYLDGAALTGQIREYMKNREENFTLYLKTDNLDIGNAINAIYNGALAHTGNPTEGDYLRLHHGSWETGEMPYYQKNGSYYVTIPFHMSYYSTAQQEAELNFVCSLLLSAYDDAGLSDYEKICGIYELITNNVAYDYEHLNDDSYTLKYSAYAALINMTAVCQGYANLFYRMALALGIDSRIVTGTSEGEAHSWNIVRLDGKYYYVDATWDSTWVQGGGTYQFFLLGSEHFGDHVPDDASAALLAGYPISAEDYIVEGPSGTVPPAESGLYHEYEWDVLALVNRERHLNGLAPVTTADALFRAAGVRAVEIATLMSHTRPDGRDCFSAITETGYRISAAGENIAGGQAGPAQVMDDWMNSRGHRENILTAEFVHMGVGYHYDRNSQYRTNWVQLFGSTWGCGYTSSILNVDSIQVEPGTTIEEMQLWAELVCASCGSCYLPILPEYCTGYDPSQTGEQLVTVSFLGFTNVFMVTTGEDDVCTDHQWTDWETVQEADCQEGGLRRRECRICHEPQTVGLPALGHSFDEKTTQYPATPADCGHAATYYYSCSNPGCDEKGTETFSQGNVNTNHHVGETELRNAKDATEDAEGYTGDTYCLSCGNLVREGERIPKLQHVHKLTGVAAKAPSCAEEGNIAYWTCGGCDKWFADGKGATQITDKAAVKLAAKDHVYNKDGICTDCGNSAVKPGDADGNGKVDNVDAMQILQCYVGLIKQDAINRDACDMDGNGKVDNVDAMWVLQLYVGLRKP